MRISLLALALGWSSWAAAAVCFLLLLRNREWKNWPFLLLLSLDEAVVVPLLTRHGLPYLTYWWIFWINQPLTGLLSIGLGWNILRAMPASEHVSLALRKRVFCLSVIVAILSVVIVGYSTTDDVMLRIAMTVSRCMTFAWLSVFLVCIFGYAASGYALPLTPLRIATGMLIRLASAAAYAFFLSTTPSHSAKNVANRCDSLIGVSVFVYWCFTIAKARKAEEDLRSDVSRLQL